MDSPRIKPKRPRIDHFLSHALTAQTGEETSLRELYAEYRAFSRPKGKLRFDTVEAELDTLIVYAPIYRTLEVGGGDAALARLGAKLNLWAVSTVYPLVFRIAVSGADAAEKAELYALIYSYLARRAVRESLLALNLAIAGQETWDEAAIAQRADTLADLAVAVWPAPGLS